MSTLDDYEKTVEGFETEATKLVGPLRYGDNKREFFGVRAGAGALALRNTLWTSRDARERGEALARRLDTVKALALSEAL